MSISLTALVEVDFFSSVALTTNPVILSISNLQNERARANSVRNERARANSRNTTRSRSLIVKTFADRERVVFLELALARSFCRHGNGHYSRHSCPRLYLFKRVPMYQPNNTYMPEILKIRSRSSIKLQILE